MANKFARANGNFDGPIWALTSGGVAGSTTTPTIGDNAIANTFTIQITGNVACDNITNGNAYGGTNGGLFNITNSPTISANFFAGTTTCLVLSGDNSATLNGSLNSTAQIASLNGFLKSSSGNLTVYGNLFGFGGFDFRSVLMDSGSGQTTIYGNIISDLGGSQHNSNVVAKTNSGTLEIYGNIVSNSLNNNPVVRNNSPINGIVNIYGNVGRTGTALSVLNSSAGSVTIYGNVFGGVNPAVSNTSTGSVTIVGNVIGDSRGGSGIASSNPAANVRISGNLIGAPNGVPAVYAAAYNVDPVPSEAYIKHANNGTGVGTDAYLYYYTTNSLSAFSVPPVSAVRAGLQYANNTLTGTCEIPAASSVTFGVPVDTTTGTATLTSNNLFDVSIASLTATDSLGARLRNSATVESVGRIIASFSN